MAERTEKFRVDAATRFARLRELVSRIEASEAEVAAKIGTSVAVTQLLVDDAVIAIDSRHIVLYVNHAFCSLLGYECNELLGKDLDVIIPPELQEAQRKDFDAYLRRGDVPENADWTNVTWSAVHKDGSVVPLIASVAEVHVLGHHIFVSILRHSDTSRFRTDPANTPKRRSTDR